MTEDDLGALAPNRSEALEVEEMRRRVVAYDNAMERERGLSAAMMSALASMPIRCPDGGLPVGAPSGGTIQALERRGLVRLRKVRGEHRWTRTALGEAVWENR